MGDWNLGDLAWVYLTGPGADGKRHDGRVVHKFELDGWAFKHYVVELETEIDPLLVVRNHFNMFRSQ